MKDTHGKIEVDIFLCFVRINTLLESTTWDDSQPHDNSSNGKFNIQLQNQTKASQNYVGNEFEMGCSYHYPSKNIK